MPAHHDGHQNRLDDDDHHECSQTGPDEKRRKRPQRLRVVAGAETGGVEGAEQLAQPIQLILAEVKHEVGRQQPDDETDHPQQSRGLQRADRRGALS